MTQTFKNSFSYHIGFDGNFGPSTILEKDAGDGLYNSIGCINQRDSWFGSGSSSKLIMEFCFRRNLYYKCIAGMGFECFDRNTFWAEEF